MKQIEILKKLIIPHRLSVSLFGLFAAIAGIAQTIGLSSVGQGIVKSDVFVYQTLLGTIDFLLPIILIGITLSLLPSEISSGLIRYYITLPIKRKSILSSHVILLYLIATCYLGILFLSACLILAFNGHGLASLSWKTWGGVLCCTPLFLLVIQLLTLFTYLIIKNRIHAFVSVLLLLFIFEITAGLMDLHLFFPTTHFFFC